MSCVLYQRLLWLMMWSTTTCLCINFYVTWYKLSGGTGWQCVQRGGGPPTPTNLVSEWALPIFIVIIVCICLLSYTPLNSKLLTGQKVIRAVTEQGGKWTCSVCQTVKQWPFLQSQQWQHKGTEHRTGQWQAVLEHYLWFTSISGHYLSQRYALVLDQCQSADRSLQMTIVVCHQV